jgi:hypothetical protein
MKVDESSTRVLEQKMGGMRAFPVAVLRPLRLLLDAARVAAWAVVRVAACAVARAATCTAGVAATKAAVAAVAATSNSMTQHAVYLCEVSYSPARSNWVRELRVDFDTAGILRIEIDRVVPYGFDVAGTLLFTSIDNERIVVDLEQRTWSSDFRGLSSGRGRCDRQ